VKSPALALKMLTLTREATGINVLVFDLTRQGIETPTIITRSERSTTRSFSWPTVFGL